MPEISIRKGLFIAAFIFAIFSGLTGLVPAVIATIGLAILGIAVGFLNRRKAAFQLFILASGGLAAATTALALIPIAGTMIQTVFAYLAVFSDSTLITILAILVYKTR